MSANKFLRVDLPKTVAGKINLVNKISLKHIADANTSPLVHIEGYVWNDLAAEGVLVNQLHTNAEKSKSDAIVLNAQRDLNLKQIEGAVLSTRDVLLGVYSNNPRKISEWGFKTAKSGNSTAKTKRVKVEIPRNPTELLTLATAIFEKHTADGTASILHVLQDYPWSVSGPLLPNTVILNNEGSRLIKDSEKSYELRDIALEKFEGAVKATRTFLMGIYKNTPKTLGDWGFVVNDSAKAKPTALKKQKTAAVIADNTTETATENVAQP
jgi:hypothetical protein